MGTSLSKLIEHVDSNVHKEYVLERYKEGLTSNGRGDKTPGAGIKTPDFKFKKPVFRKSLNLESFAQLDKNLLLSNFYLIEALAKNTGTIYISVQSFLNTLMDM